MDGLRTGREEDYEAWKQARDRHKERGVNKHFHLNAAASKWPTPGANDHKDGTNPSEKAPTNYLPGPPAPRATGRESLGGSNRRWPSPQASDWKNKSCSRDTALSNDKAMPDFAKTWATKRRLNPLFVEWLQGFPFGWISFEPWAMPSSPSKQPSPSET